LEILYLEEFVTGQTGCAVKITGMKNNIWWNYIYDWNNS
jgi:hypothetical protein